MTCNRSTGTVLALLEVRFAQRMFGIQAVRDIDGQARPKTSYGTSGELSAPVQVMRPAGKPLRILRARKPMMLQNPKPHNRLLRSRRSTLIVRDLKVTTSSGSSKGDRGSMGESVVQPECTLPDTPVPSVSLITQGAARKAESPFTLQKK